MAALMAAALTACGGSSTASTTAATAPAETTAAATATASGNSAAGSAESTWPNGSVNVVLNQTAGGGSDMLTRLLTDAMGKATGQSFVVVNDTSGGNITACETVRNAKPEGYDLLATNCGTLTRMVTGQYAHTPDDFTVLGLYTTPSDEGYCVVVKADSEFQTLEDLIAYDQANPGELVTSGQVGGFVMFMEAELEKMLGIKPTFVEGGSDGDRILTILGDSIDYALVSTLSAKQYVEAGDLRALCMVNSPSKLIPDVKTLEELGYQNSKLSNLMLLFGPKDMAQADVDAIGKALEAASQDQTLIDGYAQLNCIWDYKSPAESKAMIDEMFQTLSEVYPVVQEMGLS